MSEDNVIPFRPKTFEEKLKDLLPPNTTAHVVLALDIHGRIFMNHAGQLNDMAYLIKFGDVVNSKLMTGTINKT